MKILGSGKVDDFKKISVSDRVLDAMDVRPGDSVLFYRKDGDSGVSIFRAEGTRLTDECDSPSRNHLREAPRTLRTYLMACVAAVMVVMAAAALSFNGMPLVWFIIAVLFCALCIAGLVLALLLSRRMDTPFDGQALVTVGGPYSQNRLTGISKLSTDGYVASGDLYVSSLFSGSPSKVDVVLRSEGGEEHAALTRCVKSVPGYSLYRMRVRSEALEADTMVVKVTYNYTGKYIVVESQFALESAEGDDMTVTEGPVRTELVFDESLNRTVFDEGLFDPSDENV